MVLAPQPTVAAPADAIPLPAVVGARRGWRAPAAVAASVRAFAVNQLARGARLLGWTWLSGAVFLLLKGEEFAHLFTAGVSLSSDDFWMFYLSLTVFHFLHVVLGMVIIAAVWLRARRGEERPQPQQRSDDQCQRAAERQLHPHPPPA